MRLSPAMESARGVAWHVLVRVERDQAYADLTLHAALRESNLGRRDRALATEIAYGALRRRGRLDAALGQVMDRDLAYAEIAVRNLLRLGAYQILFLERIRHAAAVDETVKLARAVGLERVSGFLNAVLRQLARRASSLRYPELADDPLEHLIDFGSLPRWIAERWLAEFGPERAAELALFSMKEPPRTVRLSPGVSRKELARRLGGRRCGLAPDGLTRLGVDPTNERSFRRGEITVQDEASQLVPLLLGAEPGDTVVDCCAAPGGKAVQLAQQVGPTGEVIALELHPARLPLIWRAVRRLGLKNVRVLERDAAKGFDLQGRLWFSRILVDAPCTGLGVLRRNPDARWRLRADDVERSAERALAILGAAARYVEDGGVLVYSVCTFTPEETTGVVARFLETHAGFRVDDPRPWLPAAARELVDEQGALRTLLRPEDCDAFYAVRLVKT